MDENVMRVLQMLQDGKISASEAEMLIASLRGETTPAADAKTPEPPATEEKPLFDRLKTPKLDFEGLGDRISKAVSKVEPEKIVRKVQAQLRTASRAGAHWSSTMSARVKTWADGDDTRPTNDADLPSQTETHEQEFTLGGGAKAFIENPLGHVRVEGITEGSPSLTITKTAWATRSEDLKATLTRMEIQINGADDRLDVKAAAPEMFREGTVDIVLRLPRTLTNVRVATRHGDVDLAMLDGLAEGVTTTGKLSLHDLSGDARGETASGDITLERIAGAATVATQSGDITGESIQGGLTANAASGDVRATDIEGGRVEVKSVSGDARAERIGLVAPQDIVVESISGDATLIEANGNVSMKAVSGDVEVKDAVASRVQAQTVSGDVTIRLREVFGGTMQINTVSGDVIAALPEGSNVRVSLSTSSGELRCEHDAHDVTASETLWTGQVGDGSGTLNVQTISGDAQVLRA